MALRYSPTIHSPDLRLRDPADEPASPRGLIALPSVRVPRSGVARVSVKSAGPVSSSAVESCSVGSVIPQRRVGVPELLNVAFVLRSSAAID